MKGGGGGERSEVQCRGGQRKAREGRKTMAAIKFSHNSNYSHLLNYMLYL